MFAYSHFDCSASVDRTRSLNQQRSHRRRSAEIRCTTSSFRFKPHIAQHLASRAARRLNFVVASFAVLQLAPPSLQGISTCFLGELCSVARKEGLRLVPRAHGPLVEAAAGEMGRQMAGKISEEIFKQLAAVDKTFREEGAGKQPERKVKLRFLPDRNSGAEAKTSIWRPGKQTLVKKFVNLGQISR